MTTFQFSGVNLAIATPFHSDGRIDFDRLEQNIDQYISVGVRGFVLSSGTGMHVYLTPEESHQLIVRGVKAINGRAKVIAQTSALMVEDVVERTKGAADAGADGVMVLPPFFEGPNDSQGIVEFYAAVARVGLPVIGYNVSSIGIEITPSLFRQLAEIPGFVSVKDSWGDLRRQTALIETGLPVMNGSDLLIPYSLYAGCSALILGGANYSPRTCVAVAEAARSGRWEEARKLWAPLAPVMRLLCSGNYVQSVYAAAELTGYGAGTPRKPLRPLPADRLATIRDNLSDLIAAEARNA
ncbi:dihydrodipicolinate synthase family protein [Bradyrhizobium sp. U531]|uniref:dihydrodipicolinate synthase family protein n=1 Tax=Bradyrhizobium sp. U531 TaxID=3053458 RepID=UPI003F4295F0